MTEDELQSPRQADRFRAVSRAMNAKRKMPESPMLGARKGTVDGINQEDVPMETVGVQLHTLYAARRETMMKDGVAFEEGRPPKPGFIEHARFTNVTEPAYGSESFKAFIKEGGAIKSTIFSEASQAWIAGGEWPDG